MPQWMDVSIRWEEHGAWFVISRRDEMFDAKIRAALTMCQGQGSDPEQLSRNITTLILEKRPELQGMRLLMMEGPTPYKPNCWRFLVLHESLPVLHDGLFPDEIFIADRVPISDEDVQRIMEVADGPMVVIDSKES
jgi:hypothetical protein